MRWILFVLSIGLFASCSSNNKQELANNTLVAVEEQLTEFPEFYWDTLKGTYLGDFAGSDIRITITFISNKHVVGYNVYKGLVRNLSGKVVEDSAFIHLNLEEPGDNKFDGVFQLDINKETLEIEGNWDHFAKVIPSKFFNLTKLDFNRQFENGELTDKFPNNANFHYFFSVVQDSIGDLDFSEKGLVTYKYYPSLDTLERREQLIEIMGSFSVKGNSVVIDWQPNTVFPSRKSMLKIVGNKNEDYVEYHLEGDNRKYFNFNF